MLALSGTLGATGRAPVAVADAAVVLSQGLCSPVVSATDISVLPRPLRFRFFLEQSFFIWIARWRPPEDQGMAGRKRRLRKKAPEPCSPIEAEDISGGAAKLN